MKTSFSTRIKVGRATPCAPGHIAREDGAHELACPANSPMERVSPRAISPNRKSQIADRKSEGMALVITLILMSVTLVMAIAFLAVSRREKASVTTESDAQQARLAADAALAHAEAQIIGNILATTNPYNYTLLVSTNYINAAGFDPSSSNPTNVNYDYLVNGGGPLTTSAQAEQNIANLLFLPRVPVYMTNIFTGSNELSFYLDLNRNGKDDPNGMQLVISSDPSNPYYTTNGVPTSSFSPPNLLSNAMTGDPEWVGILERPDTQHSPDNAFLARYAFMAMPVGNSLDLNYIHNQAFSRSLLSGNDGYMRNQGVGTWEINLAAFWADLNTNQWCPNPLPDTIYYDYEQPFNRNSGHCFEDALALLSWRYGGTYSSLATANQLFANPNFLRLDNIDEYSDGPLWTSISNIDETLNQDHPEFNWVGADNTNHFYNLPSELFDSSKSSAQFVGRLQNAETNASTYDRYTFYRLLSQMGTDSQPESGKINLNYSNAVVQYDLNGNITNLAIVPGAETNLVPWAASNFFTIAVDQLLKTYTSNWFVGNYPAFTNTFGTNATPFGIQRIPVYVHGAFVYTPSVNRLLQIAANVYDATTTNVFPSVFRPVFSVTNEVGFTNVYITGYRDVSAYSRSYTLTIGTAPLDPPVSVNSSFLMPNAKLTDQYGNAYGVPWIIGVKKGMPSFNQLYMLNASQFTRKIEITRTTTNVPLNYATYATNQMYVLGITNNIAVSFWNSYSNSYPRPLTVYALDLLQVTLTNNFYIWSTNVSYTIPAIVTNQWPGSKWGAGSIMPPNAMPDSASFFYTNWSCAFLSPQIYRLSTGYLVPDSSAQPWETNSPLWGLDHDGPLTLITTNSLQAFILDGNNIIDYVQLRGPITRTNLEQVLADPNYPDTSGTRYQWSTNLYNPGGPMTYGTYNQIIVSENPTLAPPGGRWVRPTGMPAAMGSSPQAEAAFFNGFFLPNFSYNGVWYTNSQATIQAPYTPTRTVYDYILWQANDPLVHYLASDLAYLDPGTMGWHRVDENTIQLPPSDLNHPGKRYQPWGWGDSKQMMGLVNGDTNAYNLALQDPLVWCPENWNFPTNLYPSVGWIGRVHRGTPWQTVYLKALNLLKEYQMAGLNTNYIGTNTWAVWTGDEQLFNSQYVDAANMAPIQDRLLFDVFTTAPNENVTRGQLSVNQNHLAAWSALLSGMVVATNSFSSPVPSYSTNRPPISWTNIYPAGVDQPNSALWRIVTNINGTRTLFSKGAYAHVGDILSVPFLSSSSPFLNLSSGQMIDGISDEMYEWLPQQMMSLLRDDTAPRYAIYCYGQTLKPSSSGVVTSPLSSHLGICTNYQVVAESAARVVVRVEDASTPTPRVVVESYTPLPPD